ncbi:DMT family transporter [Clostridium sp. YIM B02551]|uniref:DMT family transporter n=1 Tax=Clostridium sp. YIM B02551 TaxID=2910679 RepID=UPI001EEB5DD7|nr:DMT family transporter [Clostridium sp. YIM B02551]
MDKVKKYPIIQALLAALLFGASSPFAKILLGDVAPVPLAAFLYLGSGIGLFIYQTIMFRGKNEDLKEAPLSQKDILWLIGAVVFGGVMAPIISMTSLKVTPASTASLLLNFEGIATTLIAVMFFKEGITKRMWIAILCITSASILLSWDFSNQWGISLGALGILGACVCWGIDNNFTRNISAKNPFTIVIIKGLGAGSFSLLIGYFIHSPFPDIITIIKAMILGCFSYGVSLVLFVLAMRSLGSARTSTFFGTAPFIGAILSFVLFREAPGIMFIVSLPIMIIGTLLLFKEDHAHKHKHEHIVHEHRHSHSDSHHEHSHVLGEIPMDGYNSHVHEHKEMEHEHSHTPDIHHRHSH